ncbi:MAG: hypothetical protein JWQ35_922 [Bacteriovoracaceae bacterium]|nr:hypothetical protein [Bacteriovoracaceae bacterium]
MEKDLSKLSSTEVQALLLERIQNSLDLDSKKAAAYAEKLYMHYKRLNVFPKTMGTLDASVKALVRVNI